MGWRRWVAAAAVAAASAVAARATTLVMLVSHEAAVIASDSLAHGSGRGVVTETRRKVTKVSPRLLIGTAGVAALADASGRLTVDLHALVAGEAGRLAWRDPHADAVALGTFLRAQLARLEQVALPGAPDRDVNPSVSVFVAVRTRRGIAAVRLTIPGALTPWVDSHRVRFGPVRVADVAVRTNAATAEIISHLPEVADGAADLVSGAGAAWPALAKLTDPRVPLSAGVLAAAARELVQYTMQRDPAIGGAIQVETLR